MLTIWVFHAGYQERVFEYRADFFIWEVRWPAICLPAIKVSSACETTDSLVFASC